MGNNKSMARRNGDRELDQLQKLKYENQKLKKENSRLRKLIQRDQADKELLHELVQQKNDEDAAARSQKIEEHEWKCYECGVGILQIHQVPRIDGIFYIRVCSNDCGRRTRLKRYTKDVKGPRHGNPE